MGRKRGYPVSDVMASFQSVEFPHREARRGLLPSKTEKWSNVMTLLTWTLKPVWSHGWQAEELGSLFLYKSRNAQKDDLPTPDGGAGQRSPTIRRCLGCLHRRQLVE